jgi:hypothetical protein
MLLVYLLAERSTHWMHGTVSSFAISLPTDTLLLWSIVVLPINLLSLSIFVLSIIVTEHGATTKFLGGIRTKISNFIVPKNSEPSTNQTDKPPTQKNSSILIFTKTQKKD